MGKLDNISERRPRGDVLPRSLAPVGICREEAAAYIGVSSTKFDEMVTDGRMPKAKRIDGRVVWAVDKVRIAFEALPDDNNAGDNNEWDASCGSNSGTAAAK